MKRLICIFGLFLPVAIEASDAAQIYLKCDADSQYSEHGPHIIVDKKNGVMKFPIIKETLPLLETETDFGAHIIIKDQILFEVSVNRHTLRYRMTNAAASAFGFNPMTAGQCSIETKKL